jgi:hypothetical protein
MARSMTCWRCSTTLRLSSGKIDDFVTCPRCLAEVAIDAGRPVVSAIQESRDTAPQPPCPSCGGSVDREWHFCPACQESLRDDDRDHRRRTLDVDVRRDSTLLTVGMILLATFGGIGIVVMLLVGFATASEGQYQVLAYILAGLFVTGLIAALTVALGQKKRGRASAVGLVAFRSLTFAGVAVLLVFLVCVAAGIYFCIACLQGGFQ